MSDATSEPVFQYRSEHSLRNKVSRALWGVAWLVLFRPTPRVARGWRRLVLKAFGARVGRGVSVAPSCVIWAPWNLELGDGARLSDGVRVYNIAPVTLGPGAIVSQLSILCTTSHDITRADLPIVMRPIRVGAKAWVGMNSFVNMGVVIGEGAVVAASANVVKDVPPWTVVGGNPAKPIKERVLG